MLCLYCVLRLIEEYETGAGAYPYAVLPLLRIRAGCSESNSSLPAGHLLPLPLLGGMALAALSTAVVSLAFAATPWPHPVVFDAGDGVLSVSSKFALQVTNPTGAHKHLHSTAKRYSDAIVTARGEGCNASSATGAAQLTKCSVTVKDTSVPLASGVNEAYDLSVGADGQCSISADTVWGAFHGMESLAQLAAENCTISNTPVRIRDTPRFGFRGLMIDTARHYMPVKFIEHIIEGMAANRLNVLHWHIVDSSSFPYCSAMFPGLCEKGAYSPRATFTADQLKSLVDFAEARGVRIMPEFDMPGHGDWEQGEPEIMVLDGPCDYTMDPTKDATYKFLAKFLKEVTTIFPDEYLFLGTPGYHGRQLFSHISYLPAMYAIALEFRVCLRSSQASESELLGACRW